MGGKQAAEGILPRIQRMNAGFLHKHAKVAKIRRGPQNTDGIAFIGNGNGNGGGSFAAKMRKSRKN
jgi:hypothetical protein